MIGDMSFHARPEQSKQPTAARKPSLRALAWSMSTTAIGTAGGLLGRNLEQLDGSGGLLDVPSHISNVFGSMAITGLIMTFGRGLKLHCEGASVKRIFAAGGIALAAGLGANAIYETPAIQDSAVFRKLPQDTPDPIDMLYGDLTTIGVVGLLGSMAVGDRNRARTRQALMETNLLVPLQPNLPDQTPGDTISE